MRRDREPSQRSDLPDANIHQRTRSSAYSWNAKGAPALGRKMSGLRRAPRGAPAPCRKERRRCAVALAPARCLAACVHQPAAQIELALDPAQLPRRNRGGHPCRRRDQRPGVEDWSDHRSLACRCSRSMPSICLSACMNSRASGARCHKRRIGIAGMPEARSGQRGGKTGDDGVSHRLIPVRQYVTKHLFPAHCARDRTENSRHRK